MATTRSTEATLIPAVRNKQSLGELTFGDGSVMSLTDMFGKRFEGSVITRSFDLINKPVQSFVRRDFVYLSRSFYVAGILGVNANADVAKVEELENHLIAIFSTVQTLVRLRLSEVSKLLAAYGADKEEVHTARPMTYKVPIIHPRANQYLELLREVDDLHSKREHAWLLSYLTPTQRSENFREVMKAVRKIGFVTRQNRIAMWKLLQRAAAETGGAEGKMLTDLAHEQGSTLVAEGDLDNTIIGSVSSESDLSQAGKSLDAALPAEVGMSGDLPEPVKKNSKAAKADAAAPAA